jgi:group I intron endonuclease
MRNTLKYCGIYKITNTINGKYYIGSSNNIKTRIRKHFELLKRNKHHSIHFQNAYNKYGRNSFVDEMLELCNEDNLLPLEQRYLDSIIDWQKTYNMSKIASGNNYDISMHPNQIQIRKKMSIGNTGKHTKPFYINDIRYETLKDAANEFNIDIKSISYRIKNWDYKNYYYENNPKIGEYDKNIHTKYWYKPKIEKKKYYCDCGQEIGKDGKYCIECIKRRRKNKIYDDNPVIINGVEFNNPKEASRILKIEYCTLLWRINSNTLTFKDYCYKHKPKNIENLISIDDINKKISEKNKGNKSSKNPKPFTIDGVKYLSLTDASKKINIRNQLIWDRLRSKNFTNYKYLD